MLSISIQCWYFLSALVDKSNVQLKKIKKYNNIYFYKKLFQVTEISFKKWYSVSKTLNIVWNTDVIKHWNIKQKHHE